MSARALTGCLAAALGVLAPEAAAARDGEPRVDLSPGAEHTVRLEYREELSIETSMESMPLPPDGCFLVLLAGWKVLSADSRRWSLEARVEQGRISLDMPGGEKPDPEFFDPGRSWRGSLPSGMTFEVGLSPLGATLETDPARILAEIEKGSAAPGGVPRGAPTSGSSIPRDIVCARIRHLLERAALEAFSDGLPSPGGSRGNKNWLQAARGYRGSGIKGGTEDRFEVSFSPPETWKPGGIYFQRGEAHFAPSGGKKIRLPANFSRISWRDRGFSWVQWGAALEHPERGRSPYDPFRAEIFRRLSVSFRTILGPGKEVDLPAEGPLDRPRLADGQVYLFDVSLTEDVRSVAEAAAGRWTRASGRIAARVVEETGGAVQGKVRFDAVFLEGTFFERRELGVAPANLFRSQDAREALSLAGLALSIVPDPAGTSVLLDPDGERRFFAAWRRDRKAAVPTRGARAIESWIQACLGGALSGPSPPPVLCAIPLEDPQGKAGEVKVLVDHSIPPTTSERKLQRKTIQVLGFSLGRTWSGKTRIEKDAAEEEACKLCLFQDTSFPFFKEATLSLKDDVAGAARGHAAAPRESVELRATLVARQIGGPRFRASPEPTTAVSAQGGGAPPVADGAQGPRREPPPPSDPLPPPEFALAASGADKKALEAFFSDLPEGAAAVGAALERYGRIEEEKPGSWLAAAVHAEAVLRLRDGVDSAVSREIESCLSASEAFPVRVLCMRLVVHGGPGLPNAEKVRVLASALSSKDPATVALAGRFLSGIREEAAVDALVEALENTEATGREDVEPPEAEAAQSLLDLRLSLGADLYRLLGRGAAGASAAALKETWKRLGRKLPPDPLAPLAEGHVTVVRTHRAFADAGSPPLVFVLDASSSMSVEASPGGLPVPPAPGEKGPPRRLSKFEWARRELGAVIASLGERQRFGIVAFNKSAWAFRGSLTAASEPALRGARSFLGGVRQERGTHLHEALKKALAMEGASTVCLLSDGHPTVGPGVDEVDRDVFRWNYLKGARMVVASFAADTARPENLCSRLARRHFGWLRILDVSADGPDGAPAEGAPAAGVLGGNPGAVPEFEE